VKRLSSGIIPRNALPLLPTMTAEAMAEHERRMEALQREEYWHAKDIEADRAAAEAAEKEREAELARRRAKRASQAVPVMVGPDGQVVARPTRTLPVPKHLRPKQPVRDYSKAEQEAAAIKIQSLVRGSSVRRRLRAEQLAKTQGRAPSPSPKLRARQRRTSGGFPVRVDDTASAAALSSSSPSADVENHSRAMTRASVRASMRRSMLAGGSPLAAPRPLQPTHGAAEAPSAPEPSGSPKMPVFELPKSIASMPLVAAAAAEQS
jgi:cobalamin biosynthesis Mg chelatase CobN